MTCKIFNDPVHNSIELHPLCVRIIDTPQFQRLRYIKQTGNCNYVFPGACHTRFEHSLGVCHLAGQLLTTIRSRQPELDITDQDLLAVEIAGLCHDLGHGPFSHMFKEFIYKVRPDCKWEHERASIQMFDHLIEENSLRQDFSQYGLTDRDLIFIKELIYGPLEVSRQDWPYKGRDRKKSFLYEIVANKRNGTDVDKWDYFARDCYHLGIQSSFSHQRLIKQCRVILNEEEDAEICFRDKDAFNVYNMFYTRSCLHQIAYQHKTVKGVEAMILDVLVKADSHIKVEGKDGKQLKMSECIDDMVAYSKLTDYIYQQILYSSEPELSDARQILHRIETRKLYRYVAQGNVDLVHNTQLSKENIPAIIDEIIAFSADDSRRLGLKADDVVIIIINIDYGKRNENPVDNVRFYSKTNINKSVPIEKKKVSGLLPNQFMYQTVRAYSRTIDKEIEEKLLHCFQKWCQARDITCSESFHPDEVEAVRSEEEREV